MGKGILGAASLAVCALAASVAHAESVKYKIYQTIGTSYYQNGADVIKQQCDELEQIFDIKLEALREKYSLTVDDLDAHTQYWEYRGDVKSQWQCAFWIRSQSQKVGIFWAKADSRTGKENYGTCDTDAHLLSASEDVFFTVVKSGLGWDLRRHCQARALEALIVK